VPTSLTRSGDLRLENVGSARSHDLSTKVLMTTAITLALSVLASRGGVNRDDAAFRVPGAGARQTSSWLALRRGSPNKGEIVSGSTPLRHLAHEPADCGGNRTAAGLLAIRPRCGIWRANRAGFSGADRTGSQHHSALRSGLRDSVIRKSGSPGPPNGILRGILRERDLAKARVGTGSQSARSRGGDLILYLSAREWTRRSCGLASSARCVITLYRNFEPQYSQKDVIGSIPPQDGLR